MMAENDIPNKTFQQKVWQATAIVALFVVVIWIMQLTFNVLLLILAGALIAVYFRGLAGLLQKKTKWSEGLCLAISITGTLLLLVLFFWFAGSKIQQQVNELAGTLPATINNLKQQLSQSTIGKKVLEQTSSGGMGKATAVAQSLFRSTFGVLGDVYVVLFIGIFFTVSPKSYVNGVVKLVPLKSRTEAKSIFNKIGDTVKKWLKGQLLAMLVVAVLTTIGLLVIGVPMAFVLALIAGLLNFIPNFGPLIAMVPAVLVGLMQGPQTALLVAALYILVQVLESNFITPQIQKKMIDMPPALIIIAQLFMGVLTGGWGLVLATPFTAIIIVLLQELYVKKQEARKR